jgi:hypothetical protein
MSAPRFSIHGGPLYAMAKARQQELIDAASQRRAVAPRRQAPVRGPVSHVDYGPWLRLAAVIKSAR